MVGHTRAVRFGNRTHILNNATSFYTVLTEPDYSYDKFTETQCISDIYVYTCTAVTKKRWLTKTDG